MENNGLTGDLITNGESVFINNAGAVLLNPFFHRFFNRLHLLNETNYGFKDEVSQIRAIFLIQYLVYGKTEFPEHELVLNKYLTGYKGDAPLPRSMELTEEEKEKSKELLLVGFRDNWQKMKHTTVEALQQAFLQREGKLEYAEGSRLNLIVEQKPYDMLLDSLPWSYSLIRYGWMKETIMVKWRN